MLDQNIKDEVQTGPVKQFLPKNSYNKKTIQHLLLALGLNEMDVLQAFGNLITVSQLRDDINKWGIRPRFFEGRSITGYYEKKIAIYEQIIEGLLDKNRMNAKYREISKIAEKLQGELTAMQEQDADIDVSTVLETNISLLDFIKTQQKDQQQLLQTLKAQDDLIKGLADIRKVETEEIKLEQILHAVMDDLYKLEQRYNLSGIATNFWSAVRIKIKGITGTDRNIFEDPNIKQYIDDKRRNIEDAEEKSKKRSKRETKKKAKENKEPVQNKFVEEVKKIQEQYKIHYQIAQRVVSEKNKNPKVSYEWLIEHWTPKVEEMYPHIFKKELNKKDEK